MVKNEERAGFGLGRVNGFGDFEEDGRWSRMVGDCCEVGVVKQIRSSEGGFVKIGVGMKGEEEEEEKEEGYEKGR